MERRIVAQLLTCMDGMCILMVYFYYQHWDTQAHTWKNPVGFIVQTHLTTHPKLRSDDRMFGAVGPVRLTLTLNLTLTLTIWCGSVRCFVKLQNSVKV